MLLRGDGWVIVFGVTLLRLLGQPLVEGQLLKSSSSSAHCAFILLAGSYKTQENFLAGYSLMGLCPTLESQGVHSYAQSHWGTVGFSAKGPYSRVEGKTVLEVLRWKSGGERNQFSPHRL